MDKGSLNKGWVASEGLSKKYQLGKAHTDTWGEYSRQSGKAKAGGGMCLEQWRNKGWSGQEEAHWEEVRDEVQEGARRVQIMALSLPEKG